MNPVTIPPAGRVVVVSVFAMATLVTTPTSAPSASLSTLVGPGRLLFEHLMARLEHGDLKSLLKIFTADA
ncbi:MAG: hypothetical protein CL466_10970 [Acidimicrobiaceae bacterium]|nr:hypothetical protein [Acidimicrobiaceae bacterium]